MRKREHWQKTLFCRTLTLLCGDIRKVGARTQYPVSARHNFVSGGHNPASTFSLKES